MIPCCLPGLLTVGYKLYGDELQLSENAIQHLYELYVKMNKQAETDPSLMQSAQQACLQLEQGYYPYHPYISLSENNNQACLCVELPSHGYPMSTNQLQVLFTGY